MMKSWLSMVAAALSLGLLVQGCSDSTSPQGGTLQVSLADAPGDFDAVNIVVDGVEVHRAGTDSLSGWLTVDATPGTYDLLQLQNGVTAMLVDHQLPAGDYTQMRLLLGAGSTVVVDGATYPLVIPSGMQSGLKLNHPFTIDNAALYAVMLDFDARRSIHHTGMMGGGQYMLRPVIHAMAGVVSGSLFGVVVPVASRAAVMAVTGTDTLTARADTLDGSFRFPMLWEGTYDLTFTPTAGAWRDTTLVGVPVVRMQATDVGTVTLPPQ